MQLDTRNAVAWAILPSTTQKEIAARWALEMQRLCGQRSLSLVIAEYAWGSVTSGQATIQVLLDHANLLHAGTWVHADDLLALLNPLPPCRPVRVTQQIADQHFPF